MLCKYYLQLGTDTVDTSSPDCMDVSAMIKNLDAIKVSYSRVDMGGVVRKCGSSIEFSDKAYDAILAHYAEHYLQSSGVFAVFIADDNWVYSKAWECPLDFATLQYDANIVTIGCVDNSAAAIIKANKKSKYEFNVSELKESADLRYDGVRQQKNVTFSVVGTSGQNDEMHDDDDGFFLFNHGWYSIYVPGIGCSTSDTLEAIEVSDQTECGVDYNQTSGFTPDYIRTESDAVSRAVELESKIGFIRCIESCVVHLNMQMSFWIDSWIDQYGPGTWDLEWTEFVEYNFLVVCGNRIVWRQAAVVGENVISINSDFQMYAGEKLAFIISVRDIENGYLMGDPGLESIPFKIGMRWYSNTHTANIDESHYEGSPIYINAIKPLSLLQGIIDKMFEGNDNICVLGTFDGNDSLLQRTLLVAAESVRNISPSKIYSSFASFCDFMESVFGYIYTLKESGYYMDGELKELDNAERETISHIRQALLTSQTMNPVSTQSYYRMLPVGGTIDEDIAGALDLTTPFNYRLTSGNYNSYLGNVKYDRIHNVFAVWDATTQKYYANFTMEDAIMQGSWYNENGHAKEMIGLNIATFEDESGEHQYGIIRNGKLIVFDEQHSKEWLDSGENNRMCTELEFKHRSDVFTSDIIKTIRNVSNLSYEFDESRAYSIVEVGYGKQDYDNKNSAKNEFNFTNNYKTDCNLTDNTLSLICPYRADCYGIEELLAKRENESNNSESTKSDNDVFIVIASSTAPVDGSWKIDRSITVQNAYTNTVFNAIIAPNMIVKNNEAYIGCFTELLKFTSSDGNSNATIGGTSMRSNINITKQLFKAGKIAIDTDDHYFPTDWEGLIEFVYAGKTYSGYLDSIDICFANLGTITYNLIEKCIE